MKLLDTARESIADDADKSHYERHHPERSEMDGVFDGLVDWVRSDQDPAELAEPLSHPDLRVQGTPLRRSRGEHPRPDHETRSTP
ncbi:hypothetical protein [Streptomyces griseus]|uniref:hypothetical protein n=1 Tax=Streptomyces griseus TaxID=1911 RepID=UPI00378DF1D3